MWPADSLAPIEQHYEVMEQCGLGPGRDNWAVAIDAAELFRWPVVMLRSVLANPPAVDADRLATQIRAFVVTLAGSIEGIAPTIYGSSTNLADAITDDAVEGVGRVVRGEPTEVADFEDMGEIIATTVDRVVADGAEDDDGEETARPFAADVRQEIVAMAERMASWCPWAKEATPDELTGAVILAARVVDLLRAIAPGSAVEGDERRAEVAWLAPWCGAELAPIGFDRFLPAVEGITLPAPSDQEKSLESPPDQG